MECQWCELPVLLTFHKPLSDYFHALKENGVLVNNLVEPRPLRKALRKRPRDWETENRVHPVLIIDAIKQNG
jgi:hypothetical protein